MKDMEVKISNENMEDYFQEFDVIRHKYFNNFKEEIPIELQEQIRDLAGAAGSKAPWSVQSAVETYRTLDKVYDWEEAQMQKQCNLLQKVTEELLGNYVGIEGIQDLFRPSYFQFEWMMHLEYMEKEHRYSYYRDHYIHQIRNLYEMFILMDNFEMWQDCMHIYKSRNDSVAKRIKDSIRRQVRQMEKPEEEILKEACKFVNKTSSRKYGLEAFCYHDLFFSTVIVSALVHDVAYPLGYMKRTLEKMRHFLPLSNWFMGTENTIPRINSLLKDSLLFEVAGSEEIEKRLNNNDHGTYSAIVLLIQYYDNGHIYKLEPLKRMVIELSALVIYNHTLRYHFQGNENERYDNVYEENPLSFLFRLCDDLQEWDRVYFEINNQGNLFVCDRCKMPMIRDLRDTGAEKGKIPYTCFCNSAGINTNLFSYRKMMNVAPFKSLSIKRDESLWHITMKCDLGALLQMAKYNPTFAVQRAKGIGEIMDMVDRQAGLLPIYVETFISNNPFAIKAAIINNYYRAKGKKIEDEVEDISEDISDLLSKCKEWRKYLNAMKEKIKLDPTISKLIDEETKKSGADESGNVLKESVEFYTFLVILGKKIKKIRKEIVLKIEKNEEKLLSGVVSFFESLADLVADEWKIYDACSKALMANALQGMFCEIDKNEFINSEFTKSFKLYRLRYKGRKDMVQLVNAYTKKNMYKRICEVKKRRMGNGEWLIDFYSDYYLFFSLAQECHLCL